MDDARARFGVGVLVVSAGVVGTLMMLLFGVMPSLGGGYDLSVVFPTADGIAADSPVVRDGVRIGRVRSIGLLEAGGVVVRLTIDDPSPLTHRYLPRIGVGNLVTGDARLEFVRGDDRELRTVFADDPDVIDRPYVDQEYLDYGGRSSSLATISGDVGETMESFQTAGESIVRAGDSLHQLVVQIRDDVIGPEGRVSREAVETLQQVQAVVRDIRDIVGDEAFKQNIDRTVDQFPELLSEAQATLQSTGRTFDSFERAGAKFESAGEQAEAAAVEVRAAARDARGSLRRFGDTAEKADQVVANLREFTRPLAERGDEVVEDVVQSLRQARRTLAEAESFAASLNNSDGTVRRLLDDEEIYYRLRRTIENVEMATAQVRPILDDVRIFSDKIARNPGQLGVRGALSKQVGRK